MTTSMTIGFSPRRAGLLAVALSGALLVAGCQNTGQNEMIGTGAGAAGGALIGGLAGGWTGAAIVFQGALHTLNPVQKVGDQIVEAITVHHMAADKEAYVRAGALLEQVGLPPRRIALARS